MPDAIAQVRASLCASALAPRPRPLSCAHLLLAVQLQSLTVLNLRSNQLRSVSPALAKLVRLSRILSPQAMPPDAHARV